MTASNKMKRTATVLLYTTHQQTEQPYTIRDVTALSVVAGLLTIEQEIQEAGRLTFSAHHRYPPGEWTHYEMFPSVA